MNFSSVYLCCGSLYANTETRGQFLHMLIQKRGAESGKQIRASLENIFESREQIKEIWELENAGCLPSWRVGRADWRESRKHVRLQKKLLEREKGDDWGRLQSSD